jgi:hypothetical protein
LNGGAIERVANQRQTPLWPQSIGAVKACGARRRTTFHWHREHIAETIHAAATGRATEGVADHCQASLGIRSTGTTTAEAGEGREGAPANRQRENRAEIHVGAAFTGRAIEGVADHREIAVGVRSIRLVEAGKSGDLRRRGCRASQTEGDKLDEAPMAKNRAGETRADVHSVGVESELRRPAKRRPIRFRYPKRN